ncbi:MAG: hypothetical protein PHR36_02285 [Patescibacteria group bacterium]|nr:hypothetical protein [Patescibacteria group bacterium]
MRRLPIFLAVAIAVITLAVIITPVNTVSANLTATTATISQNFTDEITPAGTAPNLATNDNVNVNDHMAQGTTIEGTATNSGNTSNLTFNLIYGIEKVQGAATVQASFVNYMVNDQATTNGANMVFMANPMNDAANYWVAPEFDVAANNTSDWNTISNVIMATACTSPHQLTDFVVNVSAEFNVPHNLATGHADYTTWTAGNNCMLTVNSPAMNNDAATTRPATNINTEILMKIATGTGLVNQNFA